MIAENIGGGTVTPHRLEEVYRLESTATTADERDAARNVDTALKSVQSAFDARVATHRDSREADSGQDSMRAESEADARLEDAHRNQSNSLHRLSATM
jgi:hypothetical protein